MNITMSSIFLAIILTISSCKNAVPSTAISLKIESEISSLKRDSLIQDIPKNYTIENPDILKIYRNWTKTLGLISIENGTDHFQIRIWEDLNFRKGKVTIIKLDDYNEWKAKQITYELETTKTKFPDSMAKQSETIIKPKIGWNKFVDSLIQMKIFTLPDFRTLDNYQMSADALLIKVEIANKNYYRIYEYPNPQFEADKYPTAKQIIKILSFINDNCN